MQRLLSPSASGVASSFTPPRIPSAVVPASAAKTAVRPPVTGGNEGAELVLP